MSCYYSVLVITVVVINGLHCNIFHTYIIKFNFQLYMLFRDQNENQLQQQE